MNRKLLVAVVSGALVLPMAAQGVEIGASGHINRTLVFSGLTGTDDPNHVDGASSGSRFRFTGTEELDNGLSIGANLEFGALGSADASDAPNDSPATVPTIRHASVDFSGPFGTLTVGQTAPATNLISYANLDNLAWLSGTEVGCDFCSGSGMASTIFTTFGPGRMQVVRYNAPAMGPVSLSFSADGNKFWDAALRTSGETAGGITYSLHAGFTHYPATPAGPASNVFVGTALPPAAPATGQTVDYHNNGVGYDIVDAATGNTVMGLATSGWDGHTGTVGHWKFTPGAPAAPEADATTVSVALGLAQGTHVNFTWGQKDPDTGADSEFTHFGVGHNMESTSIAATYTDSDIGTGGSSWAVGIGQAVGSAAQVYAGYKYLDHDSAAMEDYGFFVLGARVIFN